MKKLLALLMTIVCGLAGVQKLSAATLYAVLSSDEKTVTFYYDDQRAARNGSAMWETAIYAGRESKITTIKFTSSVKDARPTSGYHFFYNLYKLTTIENLDYLHTSEMINMEAMFYNCAELTSINLTTSFTTTKVQTMKSMFNNCRKLESLDLSMFNTSNVTNMQSMFSDCWGLKTIKFGYYFDTKNATNMSYMFYACKNLTAITGEGELSTAKATDLSFMFYGCEKWDMSALAEDFNTELVTDMEHMFYNCKALKSLNLKKWDMSKVTKTYCMFQNCSNLTTIYRNDDWSKKAKAITSGSSMFDGCTSLKGGNGTSYNSSKTDVTMAHPDNDGVPGYFTGEKTYGDQFYGVLIGNVFNIRYDKEQTIRGGISNITDLSYQEAVLVTSVKIESAVKNANVTSTYMWFCSMPNLSTVEGLANINWSKVTNASYMFADDTKLTSIDLRNASLTGKKCDNMFQNCSALKTIYCDEDYTSTLSSSTNMFYGCSSLQGQRGTTYNSSHTDASYARPDGGTNAPGYFTGKLKELYTTCDADTTVLLIHYDEYCEINKGDIFWNSTNAGKYRNKVTQIMFDMSMDNCHPTSMAYWFSDYKLLTEISGMMYLHTDQVTNMTETFANCSVLKKLDVSNFQTTKVTTMDAMFMGCKALTELNVNSFFDFSDEAVNAIETTTRMFAFCDKLRTIYCNNDWTTLGISKSANMFLDSKLLVGGSRSKYDAEHVDISYARPEQSASVKGYFTKVRTGVDNVAAEKVNGTKVLRNGVLLIQRGEKLYTITGQEVK